MGYITSKATLATLAAAGFLFASGQSFAIPTIKISSPGDTDIFVTDGGTGDGDGVADGKIEFSEAIGSFSFVGSTAFTRPFLGTDAVQLDTAFTAVSAGADEVVFTFSDTGFIGDGGFTFTSAIGGTSDGTVNYDAFVDDSDLLFGQAVQVGDLGPFSPGGLSFSGDDFGSAIVSSPFSMTQVITVTHTAAGITDITTGDANLRGAPTPTDVPEPATLLLIGTGLLAAGGMAVRRRAAA